MNDDILAITTAKAVRELQELEDAEIFRVLETLICPGCGFPVLDDDHHYVTTSGRRSHSTPGGCDIASVRDLMDS
jgi:hypothetical protein